ncbi:MAG: primosomal protein N', partial [Eubacterium sp.]|nr:primosomal protein N' [Eubacterium sp.]
MTENNLGKIATIIVDISAGSLDKGFDYLIPDELSGQIIPGSAVKIPFGRGNREITGYVISIKNSSDFDASKLKSISGIADREVPAQGRLLGIAGFIHHRYGGSMNQAIQTVLPIRQRIKSVENHWLNFIMSKDEVQEYLVLCEKKHYVAKVRLIRGMLDEGKPVSFTEAAKKYKTTKNVVDSLVKDGVIAVSDELVYRRPDEVKKASKDAVAELNAEQQTAVGRVCDDVDAGIFNKYLLYGVTGSGKTEVYIHILKHVVS